MKSKYLLLSTLLLVGCTANINKKVVVAESKEEHYVNIPYQYDRENRYYKVFLNEYSKDAQKYETTKEWKVKLSDTYHVWLYEYVYVDNYHSETLQDEFFISGNSYTLVLYHYSK